MQSLRRSAFRGIVIALVLASVAPAQVGGPPSPPPTLWNFLGIPQGIRKLRGATANRRGNRPNAEPKPPLKAIADPDNLESPDKSIKKAAEVKQAEDLKKQKIKAVKYLAQIGCGCYDVDGGVTEALVASMGDCTEDVRYETVKAISDAAEGECCSKCGKVCCCNKDVLTQLATMAYERDDAGCYIEPSERVREAAAEALVICCPNDSPPVIVAPEQQQMGEQRETLDGDDQTEDRETGPSPLPQGSDGFEELPSGDSITRSMPLPPAPIESRLPVRRAMPASAPTTSIQTIQQSPVVQASAGSDKYGFGVIAHISQAHRLAHIHFHNQDLHAPTGTVIGVYEQVGDRRMLLARLEVVEGFKGSANVTGTADAFSKISRGDIAVRPPLKRNPNQSVRLASGGNAIRQVEKATPVTNTSQKQAVTKPDADVASAKTAEKPRRADSQSQATTPRQPIFHGFVR